MQSKETREALAILAKAGAPEATAEEYRREAGQTRLTYYLAMPSAKLKAGRWFRNLRP